MNFRLTVILLLLSGLNLAQTNKKYSQDVIDIAEQYISSNEDNIGFDTYLENLEYYALHPINLNSATREELSSLGVLNALEIQQVLNYRNSLGSYVEVRELILAGLDRIKVDVVSRFFTVKEAQLGSMFKNENFRSELTHQLFLRYQRVIEPRKGFLGDEPNFLGDPNKYYLRYAVNYRKQFQAGFVLEKDDGEQFYNETNSPNWYSPWSGFDYSNGYLSVRSKGIFKATVFGAYSLHLGQGLISWSGLGIGKTVFALQSKKIGETIKPYTSVNEHAFYRGLASQIKINKVTVLPYLSHKKIDANVVQVRDSLDAEATQVSGIQKSGLHRTVNEQQDEKAVKETIAGLSVGREFRTAEVRANYQFVNYSAEIVQSQLLYQQNNFSNNQLHVASLDYRYQFKKLTFFGEYAYQSENKGAHLVGVLAQLHAKLDFISIYRNYASGYYAPYANGFGETNTTNNENGWYTGFELTPKKGWMIHAYLDYYKRPWLTFNAAAPSAGTDIQLQLERNIKQEFNYYFRFKHEISQVNRRETEQIRSLIDQANWRFRFHLNLEPLKSVALKSRIEFSGLKSSEISELGALVYQDVNFSIFRFNLDLNTRIAYFNTPSIGSAIYAYENDVLYSFTVPAYFNQGTRVYLVAKTELTKKIDVWFRYSRWIYTDTDTVSSGNTEITGDTRSEIKLQLRMLI